MARTLSTQLSATTALAAGLWLGGAALAGPAFADTTTVELKDSQQGSTAAAYQSAGECSGYTGTDQLWHFVVPALAGSPDSTEPDLTSITALFDAGTVTGTEIIQNGKGANVYTTGATTLQDASGTLSAPVADEDAVLVLSHACAGSGGTTGGGGGETTGGETTGGETTGGETTGGETTGGETTGGETTGGETTGGGGGGETTGATSGGGGGGSGTVVNGGSTGGVTLGGGGLTPTAGGGGTTLPATGGAIWLLALGGLSAVGAGSILVQHNRAARPVGQHLR